MSHSHRDNARARRKRGSAAYAKRATRRGPDLVHGTAPVQNVMPCAACGTRGRVRKMRCRTCSALVTPRERIICPNCGPVEGGICQRCYERAEAQA